MSKKFAYSSVIFRQLLRNSFDVPTNSYLICHPHSYSPMLKNVQLFANFNFQSTTSKSFDIDVTDERHPYFQTYQSLLEAKLNSSNARLFILSFDLIALEQAKKLNSYYLNYNEYKEILKMYNTSIERFNVDSQAVQKSHFESVRQSYTTLSTNTTAVSDAIMEEIRALESGIQLDINLEKKKTGEAFKGVHDKSKECETYMKNKLDGVEGDLKDVEKHAKAAIIGFMCLIVVSFSGYTVFIS